MSIWGFLQNIFCKECQLALLNANEELAKLRPTSPSLEGSGIERPSPSDIIPQSGIKLNQYYNAVTIGITSTNIPFTKPPKFLPIMGIPDTNSMDGLMDYGHTPLYVEPADQENQQILVDWLAKEFIDSGGLLANDCVYRIPADFSQPSLFYAIHRIYAVDTDEYGRYFLFKGINNAITDPFRVRDQHLLWLNTGIIF